MARQFLNLRRARAEKMAGMAVSRPDSSFTIISFFAARAACDAVVFDAGEAALVARG